MRSKKPKKPKKPFVEETFNRDKWLISALRRLTFRYPPAIKAQNRTKVEYFIKSSKGKDMRRVSWSCELCGKSGLKQKEKQLDHKIPVVGAEGFTNIFNWLDKNFCNSSNYQVLCKSPCHENKTAAENAIRKENRQKNKIVVDKKKKVK